MDDHKSEDQTPKGNLISREAGEQAISNVIDAYFDFVPPSPDVKDAATILMTAWKGKFAHPNLTLAAAFAAQEFERVAADGVSADAAPIALMRAFLTALIDPLSEDLDHLRQDPASGAAARAARDLP